MPGQQLEPLIVKSLLGDIERWGGRFHIKLDNLCNSKPELYGLPASKLRRSIQNRVNRLKLLSDEDYDEFRCLHGFDRLYDTMSIKTPTKVAKIPGTVSPIPTPTRSVPTPSVTTPLAPSVAWSASTESSVAFDGVIEVDIHKPERNRETFVFSFTKKPQDGILFSGVEIVMFIELPDADQYKAKLTSPDTMEIKVPAFPYSLYKGLTKTENALTSFGNGCASKAEGRKSAKMAVKDDPDRAWKRLLLCFPVELDNTIFSQPDNNGNMTVDYVINPVGYVYKSNGVSFKCGSVSIMWTISLLEYNRPRVSGSKKISALSKLLAAKASIKDTSDKDDDTEEEEEEDDDNSIE